MMATRIDSSKFMPFESLSTGQVYVSLHTATDRADWKVSGTGYPKQPTKGTTMATDIDFPESIPAPTGQAVESPRQVERRHPAQVTADRIAQTVDDYADQLTPRELDAITRAQRAFGSIARGER